MALFRLIPLILFLFVKSYSQEILDLSPVKFEIEIINTKLESREPLRPPTELNQFVFSGDVDLLSKIPVVINGINSLPLLVVEKPRSYLGIPLSNALLARSMDDFNTGNLIFAKNQLEEFIKRYKDSPYLYYAYYLLGYIEFKNGDLEKSKDHLNKSCGINPGKENCLSFSLVSVLTKDFENAQRALHYVDSKDPDRVFVSNFINIVKNGDFKVDISCDDVDVSLINYCLYLKKYLAFFGKNYEEVLKIQPEVDIRDIKNQTMILDGFSNYFLGNYSQSVEIFRNYVDRVSLYDRLSNLAIYGIGKIETDRLLWSAQILETRDEQLGQSLYIDIAKYFGENRNYLNSFLYFQKALYLSENHKQSILKNIAVSSYNMKNYRYALGILKDISQKENDPLVYLYSGYTAYLLKEYGQAEKSFYKLLDFSEYREVALEYLSDIYLTTKDEENFLETARQLRNINPDKAYDLLGWYFFEKGDYKNATKSFKDSYMKAVSAYNINDLDTAKTLLNGKDDERSKFLNAYIFLKENKIDLSRQILGSIKDGQGALSEKAFYLYAFTYFSEGKFETSLSEFKKFLDKYRDENDDFVKKARLRIADCYYNLGETDLARKIYGEFITKYIGTKDGIDASYNLLVLETREGNTDIKKMIEGFIARYPEYPLIPLLNVELADIYSQENSYDQAEKIYTELLNKDTKESQVALYKLGQVYYKKGDYDKAKKTLSEYINRYPGSDNLFNVKLLLGQTLEKQNRVEEALSVYSQIEYSDDIKFRIAELLLKKKEYGKAISYLNDLYRRHPENKILALYLGMAYNYLKQVDKATDYLLEATKSQDPKIASEGYYHLGLIFKDKDINRALNSFLNSIYLSGYLDTTNINSRFEASEILIMAGKRKEASCLLKEVLKYNDDAVKEKVENMLKDLPKCIY